jgi:Predicted ATPase
MIEQIKIKNFKSFADVSLELGALNIFIGSNASGKSNFLDVLRFLQGIGLGLSINEILNGKPAGTANLAWEGIRGGCANIANKHSDVKEVSVKAKTSAIRKYEISFNQKDETLSIETIDAGEGQDYGIWALDKQAHSKLFTELKENAQRMSDVPLDKIKALENLFASMQHLDFRPENLRAYSRDYVISRIGEHGEDFAAVVKAICADEKKKGAYLSWMKSLRPEEVDDVLTLSGASRDLMFALKEKGQTFTAPELSDGTLRFAALVAAFLQPDRPKIMTVEEIENGIYAGNLRVLVNLLKNRSILGDTQVFITTHSPAMLAWLKPEDYKHVFFCKRDEATGESHIMPLTSIPLFNEVVAKSRIDELFAEGWLDSQAEMAWRNDAP